MSGMTAELAWKLIRTGVEKAGKDYGRPVCVSVCDRRGDLTAFLRMDGAPLRTIAIAQAKAYTAARMGSSTEAFLARLRDENIGMEHFADPGLTALPGGSPVPDGEGNLLGAVGVSGLKPGEDQELAALLAEHAMA